MTVLRGAKVLQNGAFTDAVVRIEAGLIAEVGELPAEADEHDLGGGYLVPGFIDIQVNGGGGRLFNDDPTVETIAAIAAAHRRFGTCALLPTLISDDLGKVAAATRAVDEAIAQGVPAIVGIHLEGPVLNGDKAGIHDPRHFVRLDQESIDLFASLRNGRTLVTLAPEQVEPADIEALVARGVRVSLGHSLATYEQARAAEAAGLSGYTHLFNAMPGIHHRAPGPVVAALEGEAWCGLIADRHHADYAVLRLALRAKRDGRFCLVTDAMPGVGSEADHFYLGERRIQIEDGACRADDGTLAGSHLSMIEAVRNAHRQLDLELAEAIRLASAEPAAFLGLEEELGSIRPGARANLVHLAPDLTVRRTWIDGKGGQPADAVP